MKQKAGSTATRRQEQHDALLKRLEEAERRAQAAEQRAQEAETSASKASGEAKAAAEQAAQAMEAARHSGELLARMQETLARLEQTSARSTEDVTGPQKSAIDQVSSDVKSVRAAEETTAKKVDQMDLHRFEGSVTSTSKFPVKIYGSLLLSANHLDKGSNTIDIPLFAQPRGAAANQNHANYNMTVRQSRFGLRYERNVFNDARLSGVFEVDLLGGKPAFANGVDFDILRLRLAYGRVDWANDSLEAGQDWAIFSPLNPTTIASDTRSPDFRPRGICGIAYHRSATNTG